MENAHVHVGDDVTIEKNTKIKGANIIGNQVLLSGECQLEESLLLDNIMINKPLNLKRKIVTATKIICPDTGVYLETDEDISFSSKMDFSFKNFMTRYILGLFVLPLSFFIFHILESLSISEAKKFISNEGRERNVYITNIELVDSITWLGEFCKGNLRLIGAEPGLFNEVESGVFRPEKVFGHDGFANGHTSFLTLKNSYPYELGLILGS